jgi:hypothetical protein
MNTLWECTNGFIGESYVRCYVWAPDEQTALSMLPGPKEILKARKLFSADAAPFRTQWSDEGWETK